MTLIDDSDDGGEDDEQDQPLVNLKDKLREETETHDLVSIWEMFEKMNFWKCWRSLGLSDNSKIIYNVITITTIVYTMLCNEQMFASYISNVLTLCRVTETQGRSKCHQSLK